MGIKRKYTNIAFVVTLQKLDTCHAHISVVTDTKLQTAKFVESVFREILKSPDFTIPLNHELCNLASSEEIARQLVAIGKHGSNQGNYMRGEV